MSAAARRIAHHSYNNVFICLCTIYIIIIIYDIVELRHFHSTLSFRLLSANVIYVTTCLFDTLRRKALRGKSKWTFLGEEEKYTLLKKKAG